MGQDLKKKLNGMFAFVNTIRVRFSVDGMLFSNTIKH